jgi:hypothetical protein
MAKAMYSVEFDGKTKSFKDVAAVRDWAQKHTEVTAFTVWGYSASIDAYIWLQTVRRN